MLTSQQIPTVGGPGIIVEVDESKFGKRKYNKGHAVEGVWVGGGVARTADRELFLEVVEDRSAVTLTSVLKKHIIPGSIIHTDCWRGYSSRRINGFGCTHKTVNHAETYVAEDGTHTNTIEGNWRPMKAIIPKRNFNHNLIG